MKKTILLLSALAIAVFGFSQLSQLDVDASLNATDRTGGIINSINTSFLSGELFGFRSNLNGQATAAFSLAGFSTGANPAGENYGFFGNALNASANVGVLAQATDSISGGTNIGLLAVGVGAGSSGTAANWGIQAIANDNANNNISVGGFAPSAANTITDVAVYGVADAVGEDFAGLFVGDVNVTGTFTNPSSRHFKTGITEIDGALSVVKELNPVSYDYVKNEFNFASGRQFGFIAEELQTELPNLVKDIDYLHFSTPEKNNLVEQQRTEEKALGVNYIGLIPVLTKAIQEQQAQIEALQAKIEELEKR